MRLLLALDGSPSSLEGRDLVGGLRWPPGTSITLATAYEIPATWIPRRHRSRKGLSHVEETVRREIGAFLAAAALPLQDRGWVVDLLAVRGRAATAIVATADEAGADLIVLGSRGRGSIRSMLLGSVSDEVAAEARQSVLVARGAAVSRALVAANGFACTAAIPAALARWSALRGIPAIALSVAPVASHGYELFVKVYTMGSEPLERQREELMTLHQGYADEMATQLSAVGIPAEPMVRGGDAAREIIAAAEEQGADLVVTGSRCLHGVDRWLLGSVAGTSSRTPARRCSSSAPQGDEVGERLSAT